MATNLENIQLLLHSIQNMERLRVNMRNNAEGYKISLAQGKTVSEVAGYMENHAVRYLRRLQWQKDIVDTPAKQTKMVNALAVFEIPAQELVDFYVEMRNAAVAQRDAVKTTEAEIHTAADATLANVTEHDTLWEG